MKKMISIALLMGFVGIVNADEVDEINANMLWDNNEDFQAINSSYDKTDCINANMYWVDDEDFQEINQ